MSLKTNHFFGVTNTGKIPDNNEDTFIAEPILTGRYILTCVIDGVGGYEGGEVAAQIARESILNHFQNPPDDLFLSMKEALVIANEKIYVEGSGKRNHNMACVLTLAIVDLIYNQFYYAHVGDTRLYLLREHTLVKITRDHSFVGFLEDSKRLSEEEAMRHPKRNEINKALGFDPNIGSVSDYIETGISPFLPGDILLLCSDGLTDMIASKTITAILTSDLNIPQKSEELIKAANDAGGKDNITVVLVENNNPPVVHEATKPAAIKKKEVQNARDEEEALTIASVSKRGKFNRAIIILLLILCLGLAGVLLWQLDRNKDQKPIQQLITEKKRNAVEQKLQDSINQSSILVLTDSVYGKTILISDTLSIQRDSLKINGNGLVLKSDSAYTGAAFVVGANCKYLELENVIFEDFKTAIAAKNKTVRLKNVRFVNCDVSLQYHFMFPESKYVHGSVIDTALFNTDTLPTPK